MYGRLNDGVIEYAPQNYVLSDGRIIVNFNKSEVLMEKYGFKLVIDQQPTFNKDTEYLVISGYSEQDTTITVLYAIKQMDSIEQEATIDDKIAQLKKVDTQHEEALAQLTEMILSLQEGSVE